MKKVFQEYSEKLVSPEEAVKVVKSGDWVDYTVANGFPALLDKALAERKDELYDVKIRGNLIFGPIKVAECDPEREHFIYNSWHFSSYERKLSDKGLCNYIPMLFRSHVEHYRKSLKLNVAMTSVTPMDRHGYFNFSSSIGTARGILETADIVILEINENLPKVYGCVDESIHISEVDMVVEGEHGPLVQSPTIPATETDRLIAGHIIPHITDGATLQLGIGGMPGVIGERIAESDVKDIGMHTELASDAYLAMYRAGKLTNRNSALHKGKGAAGIFIGTNDFYQWIDENPGVIGYPLEYINKPSVMSCIEKLISINSCIAADLFGQVCSESSGTRQISGTGGQLDFLTGAVMSKGGKAFLCFPSTHREKDGTVKSNIVPTFSDGSIITSPRSQANYIVTEYGAVNLSGKSTWEISEQLISVAHPDFRDDLIRAAEKQNIWRRTNKIKNL